MNLLLVKRTGSLRKPNRGNLPCEIVKTPEPIERRRFSPIDRWVDRYVYLVYVNVPTAFLDFSRLG
jgi:hypothetical protein